MSKYAQSVSEIVESRKQNPQAELVLYGGGLFARELMEELARIGIRPVAICDSDKSKHGGEMNGIPIMSLEDAMARFDKLFMYIASDIYLYEISYQLQGNKALPTERIINHVPVRIERYCKFIDEQWAVDNNHIAFCCSDFGRNESPKVLFNGDHTQLVDDFIDLRKRIICELNKGIPNECSGCSQLQESLVPEEQDDTNVTEYQGLKSLVIIGYSPCNFKCVYCDVWLSRHDPERHEIDLPGLMKVLEERNLVTGDTSVCYGRGEITLIPKQTGMCELLEQFNGGIIFTNATRYDEGIAKFLKTGKRQIHVSMDAGCAKTFAKVKQTDLYDKVCENLHRYADEAGLDNGIVLKYVMLPGINDNKEDVNGFLRLAKEIKVEKVQLSSDFTEKYKIDENAILMSKYFCKRAEEMGVVCETVSDAIAREIEMKRYY